MALSFRTIKVCINFFFLKQLHPIDVLTYGNFKDKAFNLCLWELEL